MSIPTLGTLTSLPAAEHPELVADPVAALLATGGRTPTEVAVVEIDPALRTRRR